MASWLHVVYLRALFLWRLPFSIQCFGEEHSVYIFFCYVTWFCDFLSWSGGCVSQSLFFWTVALPRCLINMLGVSCYCVRVRVVYAVCILITQLSSSMGSFLKDFSRTFIPLYYIKISRLTWSETLCRERDRGWSGGREAGWGRCGCAIFSSTVPLSLVQNVSFGSTTATHWACPQPHHPSPLLRQLSGRVLGLWPSVGDIVNNFRMCQRNRNIGINNLVPRLLCLFCIRHSIDLLH